MKASRFLLLLVISALSLMAIALYNGYAITNSDTAAYMFTGFSNKPGADRPPFYGWFIHYTSFKASLWFTIFFQNLIVGYLLLKFIATLQKKIPDFNQAFIAIISIISFTCVSWITCFLMPDIFAGILLLSVILFLSADPSKKAPQIIYAFIILFCILVHNSHFLIVSVFSILLLLWALFRKNRSILKRSAIIFALSITGWLTICSVNKINGYNFTFSRSSHVFIMGRLCEMGMLQKYLDDNCATKNLKLCNYKDQLSVYAWDFMWNGQSAFYKTGGWDSSATEYNAIIHDIFTTPKYLKMMAQKSAIGTIRSLIQVKADDNVMAQGKDANPYYTIKEYFPDELNEYQESLQNNNQLSGTVFNFIYCIFFILSSIWILFNRKVLDENILFIYGVIILFFVVNAFVTSTFSTVLNRYQNRIFWVLPATNAILIIKYYWGKYNDNPTPENLVR